MSDVALIASGREFRGWLSVEHTQTLDTLTGEITLEVSRWDPGTEQFRLLAAQEPMQIKIDGQLVTTGYLSTRTRSADSKSRTIKLTGHDRTVDLVDCAPLKAPFSFKRQKVEAILQKLAEPFGLTVTAQADTGKPVEYKMDQGSKVLDAFETLCKQRRLLARSDAKGNVVLIRADTTQRAPASLRFAVDGNVLSFTETENTRERYSVVKVLGQTRSTKDRRRKANTGHASTATDAGVRRYRPLLLTADEQADINACADRAAWEVAARKAKSYELTATVSGWTVKGWLWTPGYVVPFAASSFDIQGEYLITSVRRRKDRSGTKTELTLRLPGAYSD